MSYKGLDQSPKRIIFTSVISTLIAATMVIILISSYGCGGGNGPSNLPNGTPSMNQVLQGRAILTSFGCVDCHNRGVNNPSDSNWLAGYIPNPTGAGKFQIGPFTTYAANLTPDKTTGIGGYTDQQIYNALRYGLDPASTPSVVITSTTPGQGNFPSTPHYLAPPMPWPSTRNMSDNDLWAIVAYLKYGIKPVSNSVPASQGPPNFWASSYTSSAIGPYPLPSYPAGNEQFTP